MSLRPASQVTPDELRAAVAAHTELGDGYEEALTSSLLERFDAQLSRRRQTASMVQDTVTVIVALGSISLGVVFALVAQNLGHIGGTVATIMAWIAITLINVAHARARMGTERRRVRQGERT